MSEESDATLDHPRRSPLIATAGTISGMIELHNHLAYDALPLFRISTYTIDWSCPRPS